MHAFDKVIASEPECPLAAETARVFCKTHGLNPWGVNPFTGCEWQLQGWPGIVQHPTKLYTLTLTLSSIQIIGLLLYYAL